MLTCVYQATRNSSDPRTREVARDEQALGTTHAGKDAGHASNDNEGDEDDEGDEDGDYSRIKTDADAILDVKPPKDGPAGKVRKPPEEAVSAWPPKSNRK